MRNDLRLSTMGFRLPGALTKLFLVVLFINVAIADASTTINVPTGPDPVANGSAFQTALNNAQCGDTIVLTAGATYQGPTAADQAFLLPRKAGCTGTDADFITIETSNLNGLSPSGVRIDPSTQAAAMPKLVADVSSVGMSVFTPELYANHYMLIGLEITNNGAAYGPNLVNINPGKGSSPSGYPTYSEIIGTHDFIVDRCFIHTAEISAGNLFAPTVNRTSGRGINVEGVNVSVTNSYIAGFAGTYPNSTTVIDSMGIYTVVGPGPIHIINNYIEAQFNNIFLGGGDNNTLNTATVSDATISTATLSNVNNLNLGDLVAFSSAATTPSPWEVGQVTAINGNTITFTLTQANNASPLVAPDAGGTARWDGFNIGNVEIRRNTLSKPDVWNSFLNQKAFIEIKDCVGCAIDGNSMYSGIGTSVALTPRNQGGSAPWARIENLIYTNNVMVGYKAGLITQESDNERLSVPSGSWKISNNLWYAPSAYTSSGNIFLQLASGFFPGRDIFVTHNTILQPNHIIAALGVTNGQFVFKDNIVDNGEYGVQCFVSPSNLLGCFPGFQMTGNVIVGVPMLYRPYCTNQNSVVYPSGNTCVNNAGLVGFTDLTNNSYRLAPDSPFKGKASDGTDPGVDMDALLAAQGAPAPSKAVTITQPYNGATVAGTITVDAVASSNASLARVEFYVDGQLDSSTTSSPFEGAVDTRKVPNGNRSLTAKAYDATGYVGSSSPVSVTVNNVDLTPPSATIDAPVNGTAVSGTVTLSVSATDNVGVTKVDFLVDSALIGTVTGASPFGALLNTTQLSNGPHSISAIAYDAAGNAGNAAPVSITINNADVTAPTVAVVSPASGATVSGTITVSVNALDNVGVTRVDYVVDSVLTATSSGPSPFNSSVDTTKLSNGSHSILARAYDAAGNVGSSTPIPVTVNNPDITLPKTNITSPVTGTTVSGTITLSASATDNVGVTKVDFLVDGVLIGTATSSPFSKALDTTTLADGAHSLNSRAYDAAGNVGTSASVSINVSNSAAVVVKDTVSPTVTITYTMDSKGTVVVSANATDNVNVKRVEFYVDGKLNTTDIALPYSADFKLTGPSGSKHTVLAKAYDAAGNVGTSSMITIIKK
jgi:hypothetical protein